MMTLSNSHQDKSDAALYAYGDQLQLFHEPAPLPPLNSQAAYVSIERLSLDSPTGATPPSVGGFPV